MASPQIRDLPTPVRELLVKRTRRERLSVTQEAAILLTIALATPISNKERRRKLLSGMKLKTQCSVYDGFYLALARQTGALLLTAEGGLRRAAATLGVPTP